MGMWDLLCRGEFEREIRTALLNRLPTVMREREFPCWAWKEFDKAFACVSRHWHPIALPLLNVLAFLVRIVVFDTKTKHLTDP